MLNIIIIASITTLTLLGVGLITAGVWTLIHWMQDWVGRRSLPIRTAIWVGMLFIWVFLIVTGLSMLGYLETLIKGT